MKNFCELSLQRGKNSKAILAVVRASRQKAVYGQFLQPR